MIVRARLRGFAVVAVVATLALVNLVIFGSIGYAGDESGTVALRAQSVRAFYAAESGVAVALKTLARERDVPRAGERIEVGEASVVFLELPDEQGVVVVEGWSGEGRRRIRAEIGFE